MTSSYRPKDWLTDNGYFLDSDMLGVEAYRKGGWEVRLVPVKKGLCNFVFVAEKETFLVPGDMNSVKGLPTFIQSCEARMKQLEE